MNTNETTEPFAAPGEAPSTRIDSVAQDTSRAWPAVVALLLGGVIVLGVGFGPGIAHNAAHDTRHALVFPCH